MFRPTHAELVTLLRAAEQALARADTAVGPSSLRRAIRAALEAEEAPARVGRTEREQSDLLKCP